MKPERPRLDGSLIAMLVVDGLFAQIPEVFGRTWRIDVERCHDCGATVIVQGRYSGVARATGRALAPQVVHVWDLAEGKVVRFQQYTDTWLFADATGIEPVVVGAPPS